MKPVYMGIIVIVFILFALPILTLSDEMPSSGEDVHQASNKSDIQWFKNEMRISPKYIEEQEGILGMSWLHFLLMLFLVIFFFMALIAYYRQTNRTKRILQHLLSEED